MGQLDCTFSRSNVFLGTTDGEARVLISGALHRQPVSRDQQTVTHGVVNNPESLSVSVVAFTGRKNVSRNLANGVHSIGFFGPKIVTPAAGFTLAEVRELTELGQRWHGNTTRSGCAHMAMPEGNTTTELLNAGVTCPETGQRWGGTWYTEPLPDDVRERFLDLMEKGEVQEVDY